MLSRRDFLRILGVGGATSALKAPPIFSQEEPKADKSLIDLLESDYPFPYDSEHFEAGERIVFLDPHTASINIIPREGKKLDIKLNYSNPDKIYVLQSQSQTFYGVDESLEIPIIQKSWEPEFRYRIEYRESGRDTWKSTPERVVKTPPVKLDKREVNVIMLGDDHAPDDADDIPGGRVVQDKVLRDLRLSGEAVNFFLKMLMKDPEYRPERGTDYAILMSHYSLASAIRQILIKERPDFIVHLGDHRGGFGHKWEGLGLKNQQKASEADIDLYAKIFRLGTRKLFSALSPYIPIYWTLGNHDGEAGFYGTRIPATKYRKKYFKLPGLVNGGSSDENYYPVFWGAQKGEKWLAEQKSGGLLFVVLDCMRYNPRQPLHPHHWTLGLEQKEWFRNILKYEAERKFVFCHHVLGGWPTGSDEMERTYSYGRGPLFSYEDYAGFYRDPNVVEQVELTQLIRENGVEIEFYGHDHILFIKEIRGPSNKKTYGMCVGSPKPVGELSWYKGEYWNKFYGDYGLFWGMATKADYWGPAGYTKLTIKRSEMRVDYIRSDYNHPQTNISSKLKVGDIVYSRLF